MWVHIKGVFMLLRNEDIGAEAINTSSTAVSISTVRITWSWEEEELNHEEKAPYITWRAGDVLFLDMGDNVDSVFFIIILCSVHIFFFCSLIYVQNISAEKKEISFWLCCVISMWAKHHSKCTHYLGEFYTESERTIRLRAGPRLMPVSTQATHVAPPTGVIIWERAVLGCLRTGQHSHPVQGESVQWEQMAKAGFEKNIISVISYYVVGSIK